MPSVAHLAVTHLGLDVHNDTISVAILAPDRDGPDVERITHDEASIRRLVGRFPEPRRLRACYEAGPTGYELAGCWPPCTCAARWPPSSPNAQPSHGGVAAGPAMAR